MGKGMMVMKTTVRKVDRSNAALLCHLLHLVSTFSSLTISNIMDVNRITAMTIKSTASKPHQPQQHLHGHHLRCIFCPGKATFLIQLAFFALLELSLHLREQVQPGGSHLDGPLFPRTQFLPRAHRFLSDVWVHCMQCA